MKGLILSGGKGTRLRPLTYTSAKQLVPIANKPVLFYGIEAMADAGIRDIGIVVGDTQAEIRAAVGDGSRWGVRVTYIEQDAPRGLAHAVKISETFIGGDPFVMYLGDNLLNKGITSFVQEFTRDAAGRADPADAGARSADVRRRRAARRQVVRLVEKPKEPIGDHRARRRLHVRPAGLRIGQPDQPSFRNELEITDAIQDLIDRGLTVRPHIVEGWWKDTGKLEDMLEANRLILETFERRIDGQIDAESRVEGKVVVEAGAIVERSVIRGPAIIGHGARITHAYIGPFTSIMNDVVIQDTEIEHSIVLECSSLRDLANRVTDSLIGKNVRIYREPVKPSASASCSATTPRSASDGERPGHRRRRVHRQQLRALCAGHACRLARHHARQADLRRTAREPARRDGRTRVTPSCTATSPMRR